MQPDLDVNEAVSAVDRLNGEGVSAGKLVRIHGIAFPNIFMGPQRFQETGNKYISYMLALTQRNGGTFEIVDFAWNSQIDRSSEERLSVQSPQVPFREFVHNLIANTIYGVAMHEDVRDIMITTNMPNTTVSATLQRVGEVHNLNIERQGDVFYVASRSGE